MRLKPLSPEDLLDRKVLDAVREVLGLDPLYGPKGVRRSRGPRRPAV